ncbi:MAG: HEPN domain-containing protein [Pseudomonadota bacterium]
MADASAWFTAVEDDLRQVRNNLHGPEPSATGAAYHCQQAAEKLVKAALVTADIDTPKWHDIAALIHRLPDGHPWIPAFLPLAELTVFASAFRYPGHPAELVPPQPTPAEIQSWHDRIQGLLTRLREGWTA